jgi:phage gpG-like protein
MPHWTEAVRRLEQIKQDIPKIVGNEMVNTAMDNIKLGKDVDGKPFTPRNAKAKRNTGRAILVDSGRGRRSVRDKKRGDKIVLEAEDYMVAHNEGVNKTVSARSKKGKTYSRRMKLPKRQFAGESDAQTSRIEKIIANRIVKALS